jgi:lysine 2,3-aminomutase
MPQYVISQAPGKVVLRNYEGFITTYHEPETYVKEAISGEVITPKTGVSGLLEGDNESLTPQGTERSARTSH